MSSPQPPSVPYEFWASADDWRPGHVMLAANVDSIPSPPPRTAPVVRVDGLWAEHEWTLYPQPFHPEFPYLPWIRLPPRNPPRDILRCAVDKKMWRPHVSKTNTHLVQPEVLDDLRAKLEGAKAAVEMPFHEIRSSPCLSSVQHPRKAYARAFEVVDRLEREFDAWRDFVEVFRNAQRSLIELFAFADWWVDFKAEESRPPFRAPTRGAIFYDEERYARHVQWSVASFLLIPSATYSLDPRKRIQLSPRSLSKTEPMTLRPLLHSLPHWYYPPHVENSLAEFETAARGYADRLDSFNPTEGHKRRLEKVENQHHDEDGRSAKRAKMWQAAQPHSSNNLELRRSKVVDSAPVWFPKRQEIWDRAMFYVNPLHMAQAQSPRRFAFPPLHLFWGAKEENQRTFYYHYLLLRRELSMRTVDGLPGLTTAEWRSILGHTYWKSMWPKPDSNDPSRTSSYDPTKFWIYGGPLCFTETTNTAITEHGADPTSLLACNCEVEMDTADDVDVRQTILYHLNLNHALEEIREMDRLQFPLDQAKRWDYGGRLSSVDGMTDMWGPIRNGGVKSGFFEDKTAWRTWLRCLREVVMEWDGFDAWDWGSFTDVRTMGINKLSQKDFYKLAVHLLTFFIHTFITRLGYYPSFLLHPPILAGPCCSRHRKKFATGPFGPF
ncbi:hypothetical protein BGW80DRAFT_1462982 [Lactifluus volemus]|nr:hypothetical protein BGW80DRAFT_1255730 [Lactifluus volemus]KAH9963957.1 hypothetical protein BGW80DRAFT_1462982 [Lactifluus volemus]